LSSSDPGKEEDSPEVTSPFILEIKHRYNRLYLKCKKAKKNTQPGEKPAPVKTHLRDAIIMPEMVGNFVSVYNGKSFNPV
jgi:small subunit ribosomal protein S15e